VNTNMKLRLALTTVVCAASFYVSYRHILEVALSTGNTIDSAVVYPITIDALILVSALTLIATTGVSKMAKLWATAGRAFGFAATVYCNLAASHFTSVMGAIVNMIPAVALIITVELLVYGWKATPATRPVAARKAAAPRKATAKAAPKAPAKLTAVK
jgi:drug/metabolite transporter (DMT)-like permease